VQGFGNVGYHFARLAHERGFKIVALSDSQSAIYSAEGIDPVAAFSYKKAAGSLAGYAGTTSISGDEILAVECDVLVPAALENQLTAATAPGVKAKAILELANGPTTPEADANFSSRGIVVIPDVLANAGGVAVSYYEWEQNRRGETWTEEEVAQKLGPLMFAASSAVAAKAAEKKITMRLAAFAVAIDRIAAAMAARN
jgi:glutamate dehydrogenase/leucine dehydrogenase